MTGMRPLTDQEIVQILSSFEGRYPNRDKLLLLIGIKTGLRISEMLSLKVKDVLQFGTIMDKVSVERKNMKRKVVGRTILLHPEVKHALSIWLDELSKEPGFTEECFVFQSASGKNVNKSITRIQAWRILDNAYSKNHLQGRLGTHSLRKTFAGKIYEKLNHDLLKTQRALGHKNINSTIAYLSFKEEDIEQAILAI